MFKHDKNFNNDKIAVIKVCPVSDTVYIPTPYLFYEYQLFHFSFFQLYYLSNPVEKGPRC